MSAAECELIDSIFTVVGLILGGLFIDIMMPITTTTSKTNGASIYIAIVQVLSVPAKMAAIHNPLLYPLHTDNQ